MIWGLKSNQYRSEFRAETPDKQKMLLCGEGLFFRTLPYVDLSVGTQLIKARTLLTLLTSLTPRYFDGFWWGLFQESGGEGGETGTNV